MRHSYTKISMYMECPRKKRYKYDERRDIPASPAAQRGIDYHRELETAISSPEPTQLSEQFTFYSDYLGRLRALSAQAEYKFALTKEWTPVPWESSDAWVIGVADVWVASNPTSHVQDWKTGQIYPNHENQGEFYATSLFSYVPEAREIRATFIYTDLRKTREWTYHRDQLDSLRSRWASRIERMERDTENAPTPSFRCRSCPFSRGKGGPCQF